MANVVIQRQISGTRNGVAWPAPGETLDVPQTEAEGLISLGIATAGTAKAPEPTKRPETRTVEPTKRATRTPRKSKG